MNLLSEIIQNSDLTAITSLLGQSATKSEYTDCGSCSFEKVFEDIKDFNNIAAEIETKLNSIQNEDNSCNVAKTEEGNEIIEVFQEEETTGNDIVIDKDKEQLVAEAKDTSATQETYINEIDTETENISFESTDKKISNAEESTEQKKSVFQEDTNLQSLSDVFVSQYVLTETNEAKENSDNILNNVPNSEVLSLDDSYTNDTSILLNTETTENLSAYIDEKVNMPVIKDTINNNETNISLVDKTQDVRADKLSYTELNNSEETIVNKQDTKVIAEQPTETNKGKVSLANKDTEFKPDNNNNILGYKNTDTTRNIELNVNNAESVKAVNSEQKTQTNNNNIAKDIKNISENLKAEVKITTENNTTTETNKTAEINTNTTSEFMAEDELNEIFIKTQIMESSETNSAIKKDKPDILNISENKTNNISANKDITEKDSDNTDNTIKKDTDELSEEGIIKSKKTFTAQNENIHENKISVSESVSKMNPAERIHTKTEISQQTKNDILNQISTKFEQLKDNTTTKINIVLRPENLGRVGVELVSRADGISARILADTQQVKELLDKNIDVLKNSLQTQGVNVNNITVKAVESSQNSEFNTAHNFDFSNEQNQQRNNTLKSESDSDFENHRKYDSEDENDETAKNENYKDNVSELREAERLYSKHNGQVDLVV